MEYSQLSDFQKEHLGHLFDPDNHLSLYHCVPKHYYSQILGCIFKADPEVLELISDEELLLKYLNKEKSFRPTVNDQRLRYLFWHEYENAQLEKRDMVMNNVHSLVCNAKAFHKLFIGTLPYRVAFLVCRPAAYQQTLREMLLHGMKRMRQVLDMPEVDEKGKVNTKIIELKLKITAMVDMRIHGAPTQKIHQVTQNIPSSLGKDNLAELIQKGDMGSIQGRLEEIEAEKKRLEGRTISVVPVIETVKVTRD